MQGVLDENPSVDAVVGNWDVIAEFIKIYGGGCLDPGVAVKLELDAENIAFIVWISPRINDRASQTLGGSAVHNEVASEGFAADFLPSPTTFASSSAAASQSCPEVTTDNLLGFSGASVSLPMLTETDVQFGLTMDWKRETTDSLLLNPNIGPARSAFVEDSFSPMGDLGHSRALGKPLRACVRCKRLKMKCERQAGDSTCRRCGAGDYECVPSSSRRPRVPKGLYPLGPVGGYPGENGDGWLLPSSMCEKDAPRGVYNSAQFDDEDRASTPELDPASSTDPSPLTEPGPSLPSPRPVAVVSWLGNEFEDLCPQNPKWANFGALDKMGPFDST